MPLNLNFLRSPKKGRGDLNQNEKSSSTSSFYDNESSRIDLSYINDAAGDAPPPEEAKKGKFQWPKMKMKIPSSSGKGIKQAFSKSTTKLSNFLQNMKVNRRTRDSVLRRHFSRMTRHGLRCTESMLSLTPQGSSTSVREEVEKCYERVFGRSSPFHQDREDPESDPGKEDRERFRSFYHVQGSFSEGSFSKVYIALHRFTGESVALKIIEKKHVMASNDLKRAYLEISAYEELEHPNICKMYQWFDTGRSLILVLEKCNGDLLEMIQAKGRLGEPSAKTIFTQIVEAVQYMHGRGFVHRDLKPENVLFDTNGNVKLIDLNLVGRIFSGRRWQKLHTHCGTIEYAAPELLQGPTDDEGYEGPPVDCWSLGSMLFTMLTGKLAFEGPGNIFRIMYGTFDCPSFLSKKSRDLIEHILEPDPKRRFNTAQILDHEWISGKTTKDRIKEGLGSGTFLPNLPKGDGDYQRFLKDKYQTDKPETRNLFDPDIVQLMARELEISYSQVVERLEGRKLSSFEAGVYNILSRKREMLGKGVFETWKILWRRERKLLGSVMQNADI